MINIFVYGLDAFVVGDLSKTLTGILARTYEVSEDEINFIAPDNMVFHNGEEQTSWLTIVEIKAPEAYFDIQDEVSKVIFHYFKELTIHIEITFSYFSNNNRLIQINPDYPRYLSEANQVNVESDYDEDMEEGEGEDQIYTGDIFANVGK